MEIEFGKTRWDTDEIAAKENVEINAKN